MHTYSVLNQVPFIKLSVQQIEMPSRESIEEFWKDKEEYNGENSNAKSFSELWSVFIIKKWLAITKCGA